MTTVDARGLACPLPVVNTKKALAEGAEAVEVLVDNPIAVENLQKFAAHRGYTAESEALGADYRVILRTSGAAAEESAPAAAEPEYVRCGAGPRVAVISADHMGEGDETLGKTLMKAFLFALTKQDVLPDTLLFYNGGAHLTCQGSQSLEDIRYLAEQGVEVLTCGTCLDFYDLKEKLAVGGVSNMYEIAEKMLTAGLILRP